MASLKKEFKSVLDRFEAAQQAFTANSTDLKKLTKKHKKELKAAQKESMDARTEVERLKAELTIAQAELKSLKDKPAAPAAKAKPAAKRGAGRPRKATATKPAAAKKTTAKPAAKKTAAGGAKRGPGRPRSANARVKSPLEAIAGVGPGLAANFEAAGVKSPAGLAKMSNDKMAAVLAKSGPRYRNADSVKMQSLRDAAAKVQ